MYIFVSLVAQKYSYMCMFSVMCVSSHLLVFSAAVSVVFAFAFSWGVRSRHELAIPKPRANQGSLWCRAGDQACGIPQSRRAGSRWICTCSRRVEAPLANLCDDPEQSQHNEAKEVRRTCEPAHRSQPPEYAALSENGFWPTNGRIYCPCTFAQCFPEWGPARRCGHRLSR